MIDPDKRLLRRLTFAVLIKLAVLAGLWWAYVRDSRVVVDAEVIAHRLAAPTQISGEKK
ncbi:MAG: cytochrome oxidase putative small subunit CydP [Pseudomonadota bacterium]